MGHQLSGEITNMQCWELAATHQSAGTVIRLVASHLLPLLLHSKVHPGHSIADAVLAAPHMQTLLLASCAGPTKHTHCCLQLLLPVLVSC
jgi:hypothetical protein